MPEPNTHIAAGLGISWLGAKLLGLDTDYLIVGMVGSLLAVARSEPEPYQYKGNFLIERGRRTFRAVADLCAVSFVAASFTSIGVIFVKALEPAAVPIAGAIGFFGQPVIKSITQFIGRAWRVGIRRLGGTDADTE
jgi:hypothetical protein